MCMFMFLCPYVVRRMITDINTFTLGFNIEITFQIAVKQNLFALLHPAPILSGFYPIELHLRNAKLFGN